MSNKIQIKRSVANGTVTGLANGELAFTQASNTLWIGLPDGSGVASIGGVRSPGVLTANQALVANSTSGIDKVIVANLAVTSIWANGAAGDAGQVLTSNSTGVYWKTPSAGVSGTDTQVQFNDSGTLAGDDGLTFNKTTDKLTVGKLAVANTDASSNTTTGALTVAGGLGVAGRINVTDMAIGNDSVYASINNSIISTNNLFATGTVNGSILSVGGWVIANQAGVFTSGGVNGSVIGVGTQFSVNTTQVSISQGMKLSANGALGTANQVLRSDSSGTAYWSDDTGDISEVVAGSGLTGGGTSGSVTLDVGAANGISVSADAVSVDGANGISVDASGVNVQAGNDGGLSVNSTGVWVIAGEGLTTNATGLHVVSGNGIATAADSVYVVANNGIASNSSGVFVVANNGVISNSSGVFVQAGDGIAVNSTGVHVVGNTGVTSNSSGVFIGQAVGTTDNVTFNDITINGNTKLGDSTSDVISINGRVNTSIIPAANNTYDLGSTGLRWKDLYLSGTTMVLGNVTISDVSGALTANSISATVNLTSQDVTINGNTIIGSSSADALSINASVNTNIIPAANVTYNVGNNTLRWGEVHAANIHSVTGYFDGTVQVAGDLVVTGNLTTTNVNSVVVSDPMIYLAGNNYSGDLVDIGFAANYNNGVANLHTGFFRDASDGGIWKLFQGSEQELSGNNLVNTAANGFTLAIMQSYLQSGALTTNATSVYITANSTVNVNIVANTLTLSSPLIGTSGGTGLSSYTAEDILVANTSNGFRKLGLGTAGYVLQSNGSALVYDTLDGGTF